MAFGKVQLNETALLLLVGFLLIASPAIVLGLRQISEFGSWQSIAPSTWAYMAAWYGALLAGFALSPRKIGLSRDYCPLLDRSAINRGIFFLCIVAAAGAAMVIYEFAIIRGYGFSTPIADVRTLEVIRAQSGLGSWLSGVGRLFVSALAVAWILTCLRWRDASRLAIVLLLFATVLVFYQQMKFEGGRFFFTALSFAALFASVTYGVSDVIRDGRVKLSALRLVHLQPILLIVGMSIGISVYNDAVFASRGKATNEVIRQVIEAQEAQQASKSKRATESGIDAQQPASESVRQENIETVTNAARNEGVTPSALTYLQYASSFPIDISNISNLESFDPRKYRLGMAWIYITQGFNEFDRIFRLNELQHSYLLYQFPQLAQILSKISRKDMRYDLGKNLPNVGTYITLPGAYFLDFGVALAVILAFVTGFMFRYSLTILLERTGSVFGLIAPFLFVILAFAPITTLFPNFWPAFVWIALLCLPSLWKRISVRQTGSA